MYIQSAEQNCYCDLWLWSWHLNFSQGAFPKAGRKHCEWLLLHLINKQSPQRHGTHGSEMHVFSLGPSGTRWDVCRMCRMLNIHRIKKPKELPEVVAISGSQTSKSHQISSRWRRDRSTPGLTWTVSTWLFLRGISCKNNTPLPVIPGKWRR